MDEARRSPLAPRVLGLLRCPRCRQGLRAEAGRWVCMSSDCGCACAVIRGVPLLVSPDKPLRSFRNEFENQPTRWRRIRRRLRSQLPNIVLNVGGRGAIQRFLQNLSRDSAEPVILNLGEKHDGLVMHALRSAGGRTMIHADVALGPHTHLVVDCRHLPFADQSLDAVIIDSGFEHEIDARAAALEVWRVLRPNGLLYADLPFMMPVHAGPSDFQRFSSCGLRALFREFEEIERGVSCGPFMALSQMIQYSMLSMVRRQWARVTIKLVCRFGLFWLKYVDLLVARCPGAMDAAGGTYFIGRKSSHGISDEEIERGYCGIVPSMYEPLREE